MSKFLARVEPTMSAELLNNIKSTAFDGYTVRWDDVVDTVSCLHTFTYAQKDNDTCCLQVAWNKTGSMVGAA
ncbi:WD repeat-containing protein 34 [Entophlyctis sp. JEL0112]|nr:WD repeat-containing protein 34 [Entophlyctis sp. JEL0112]